MDINLELTPAQKFFSYSHYLNFLNYLFNLRDYQINELTKYNMYFLKENNQYVNLADKLGIKDLNELDKVQQRKKILDFCQKELNSKQAIQNDIIYLDFKDHKFSIQDLSQEAEIIRECVEEYLVKEDDFEDIDLVVAHLNQILPTGVGTDKEKPPMMMHLHRVYFE